MQKFGQFCMCVEALRIQEINALFNSMKTLIIVLEFAMYSLELEKKNSTLFFFHNVSGNSAVFFYLA
jgi:hypothetical protein